MSRESGMTSTPTCANNRCPCLHRVIILMFSGYQLCVFLQGNVNGSCVTVSTLAWGKLASISFKSIFSLRHSLLEEEARQAKERLHGRLLPKNGKDLLLPFFMSTLRGKQNKILAKLNLAVFLLRALKYIYYNFLHESWPSLLQY